MAVVSGVKAAQKRGLSEASATDPLSSDLKCGLVKRQKTAESATLDTKVWRLDDCTSFEDLKSNSAILEASELLKAGKLVAFPTETVYGLGANALSATAAAGIFRAKGRPSDNPLIVHIAEMCDLRRHFGDTFIPAPLLRLADCFWPGPLSIVIAFEAPHCGVCELVRAGLRSVAVRMPRNAVARALIHASALPIAAPSANRSGRPSPTCAGHVLADLRGRVHAVLDAGKCCRIGLESTVLKYRALPGHLPLAAKKTDSVKKCDFEQTADGSDAKAEEQSEAYEIVVLRPGAITAEMIADCLRIPNERVVYAKEVSAMMQVTASASSLMAAVPMTGAKKSELAVPILADGSLDVERPEAPGMKYKHYAPSVPLYLVATDSVLVECVDHLVAAKKRVGLLLTHENEMADGSKCETDSGRSAFVCIKTIGSRKNVDSIGQSLFEGLRHFDSVPSEERVELILAEMLPFDGIGVAVMNRLCKAAGCRVVNALSDLLAFL